jgi:hypothetical protein
MKITNIVAPAAASAILAGVGIATAPTAAAFPTTDSFGARAKPFLTQAEC